MKQENLFKCEYCDKTFTSKSWLEQHIIVTHNPYESQCAQCDYKTTLKSYMKKHVQRIHTHTQTKERAKCVTRSWTGNPWTLRGHSLIHSGKKYKCDICDKEYPRKEHVKNHKNRDHFGIRFPCPKCDYKATVMSSLNLRIKSKHEGKRSQCSQCDYDAFDKQTLLRSISI